MANDIDTASAAAAAAREAARRAAEEAARRAAEEAARKAAAEAAAAAAAKARLGEPPRRVKADELSNGQGSALVRRGLAASGGDLKTPQLVSDKPTLSLKDLLRGRQAPVDSTPQPAEPPPPDPVEQATKDFEKSVKEQNALDATRKLNTTLESLPPQRRGEFLDQNKHNLEQLTEKVTALGKDQTRDAVKELARAAELAGPIDSKKLTDPIAHAIADGRLEQKGGDANGGPGGIFRGVNTHNSEREFVDGIKALKGQPGGDLFQSSLTASLASEGKASSGERADRATGFAGAVVTGNSDLVPDKGVWHKLSELGKDVVGAVDGAVKKVEELREQAADAVIEGTTGLSESIDKLQPGDTLTLGGSAGVSAEVAGDAAAKLEVKKNEDGTYTVSGSAELLAGVGALDNDVEVGGAGKVEFKFKNAEEAKEGAKILLRGGDASKLAKSLSSVELDGKAAAALDARFGLSGKLGGGAEGSAGLTTGIKVEFTDGKPTAIVSTAELELKGTAEASNFLAKYGQQAFTDPKLREDFKSKFGFDVSELSSVTVNGKVTVKVEQKTPIDVSNLGEVLKDPSKIQAGSPTLSGELEGRLDVNGHGVYAKLSLDGLKTDSLGTVVDRVKQGDFEGAIAATGAKQSLTLGTYWDESRGWLDHELDVGVAKIAGQNNIHHVDQTPVRITVEPDPSGKQLIATLEADGKKLRVG